MSYSDHSACLCGKTKLNSVSEDTIQIMYSQTSGTFPEHQPGLGATVSNTMSNLWLTSLPRQEPLEVFPVFR